VTAETSASQARIGFLEAVAAAALWGSSGIFAVRLFELGVTPTSVALFRMTLGTLLLLLWAAVFWRDELRLGRRDILLILVGGGIPMAAFQVVYQFSIDAAGVPTTVALLYLAPVFVVAACSPAWAMLDIRSSVASRPRAGAACPQRSTGPWARP
jgi:drug/metabolite transporter (DMT)-like permease